METGYERYLLFKNEDKWTPWQRQRAEILFHHYPSLEVAYKLTMQLKGIYHTTKDKKVGGNPKAYEFGPLVQCY